MKTCRNSDKGQKKPISGFKPPESWHLRRQRADGSVASAHHNQMRGPHWWIWLWPHISPESPAWTIQRAMGGLEQAVAPFNQSEGEVLLALGLRRPMGARAGERRAQSERSFHGYGERIKEVH